MVIDVPYFPRSKGLKVAPICNKYTLLKFAFNLHRASARDIDFHLIVSSN